ncbi:hypothetical protein BV20DRAFT_740596 [Pilatotrama ljubarskyi]|nr:hypothetical protein BV20DRAFT_740596 [Pilatotrama ljubarskyi]
MHTSRASIPPSRTHSHSQTPGVPVAQPSISCPSSCSRSSVLFFLLDSGGGRFSLCTMPGVSLIRCCLLYDQCLVCPLSIIVSSNVFMPYLLLSAVLRW